MSEKVNKINKRTDNLSQGYTLIEVLIAIAIFSIGFLAVGSMQLTAMRTGVNSRSQTTVLSIAKDRAEELESLPWTHADLAGSAAPGTTHAPLEDGDGIDNDENGWVDDVYGPATDLDSYGGDGCGRFRPEAKARAAAWRGASPPGRIRKCRRSASRLC